MILDGKEYVPHVLNIPNFKIYLIIGNTHLIGNILFDLHNGYKYLCNEILLLKAK